LPWLGLPSYCIVYFSLWFWLKFEHLCILVLLHECMHVGIDVCSLLLPWFKSQLLKIVRIVQSQLAYVYGFSFYQVNCSIVIIMNCFDYDVWFFVNGLYKKSNWRLLELQCIWVVWKEQCLFIIIFSLKLKELIAWRYLYHHSPPTQSLCSLFVLTSRKPHL